MNLLPRRLGDGDDGSGIRDCLRFYAAGDLLRTWAIAEGEADEFEGSRDPLIAKVGNDCQTSGNCLRSFFIRRRFENAGTVIDHEIDLALANNPRSHAREHREPRNLWVRQKYVVDHPLQQAALLILIGRNRLRRCGLLR